MVSFGEVAAASVPAAEKVPKLDAHPHDNAAAVEAEGKKRGRNYGERQTAIVAEKMKWRPVSAFEETDGHRIRTAPTQDVFTDETILCFGV